MAKYDLIIGTFKYRIIQLLLTENVLLKYV